MRTGRIRFDVVKRVIVQGLRRSRQAELVKETERKSIISATIAPEVWIMSGLLLSVVTQIVYVNRVPKLGDDKETKDNHER